MEDDSLGRTGLEVAIIGMACRFPGAKGIEDFWRNLRHGIESISSFSEEELREAGVSREALQDPSYVRAAAILDDIDRFDASFFGINPREAAILDPQHRCFLECAWEALENAACMPEQVSGKIGAYAGTSLNSYLFQYFHAHDVLDPIRRYQTLILSDKDYLSTRLAYKLGLTGPAVSIQTACSTSLVAVHLATRALLGGECDVALAGGVSIKVPHKVGYFYREGGIASPDGHCRAFDAAADGSVGGNGVGVVVLKRLADALEDRDPIHAVILGSAINNDGSLKAGYTAPSVQGQRDVVKAALLMCEMEPKDITYVEAHGSGTALGDPIEMAALSEAFGGRVGDGPSCGVGSVKTNIGHLDAAAGIAGLIKTVLALEHRELPPSLHFEHPNPAIDFASSPFYVVAERAPWISDGVRRAGVSSFGIGGTNAHVIVEEAPPVEGSTPGRAWQVLTLSACTPSALEAASDRLATCLGEASAPPLADAAYTLQVGRRSFEHRRALVCRCCDGAVKALRARDPRAILTSRAKLEDSSVVFLFSGLGSQYVGMGADLYQSEEVFRQAVDRCCKILQPLLDVDLLQILYPSGEPEQGDHGDGVFRLGTIDLRGMLVQGRGSPDPANRLTRTGLVQPAVFVIEYALGQLWISWGVRPQVMLGYSIGEYVAACLAGVFSLEDALALVARRAMLIERLPPGAMLAVPLPQEELSLRIGSEVSISAVNGPAVTVVAGPAEAIEELAEELAGEDVLCQRLQTSHAFHSKMMRPIAVPLVDLVSRFRLRPPEIPYLSNVTGKWIRPSEAVSPEYYARHTCEPVRFADALTELAGEPRVLLEVGPGQSLTSLAAQHPIWKKGEEPVFLSSLPGPYEQHLAVPFILSTAAKLWLAGVGIDWQRFHAGEPRRKVALPTYPFEQERFWIDASEPAARRGKVDSPPRSENTWLASWKRLAPPLLPPPLLAGPHSTGLIVVFDLPGLALGEEIVAALEPYASRLYRALPGPGFERLDEITYRLDPGDPTGYQRLFDQLAGNEPGPLHVFHLWSLEEGIDDYEHAPFLGATSLHLLGQAVPEGEVRLCVVSLRVYRLFGSETICVDRAALSTACIALRRARPEIECRFVDLGTDLPAAGSAVSRCMMELLLAEALDEEVVPAVAYRGGQRWGRFPEPLDLPVRRAPIQGKQDQSQEGPWLLSGVQGDATTAVAERIAEVSGGRLALLTVEGIKGEREAKRLEPSRLDLCLGDDEIELESLEEEVVADLRAQGLESYRELEHLGNELCASMVYRYLMSGGLRLSVGSAHEISSLRRSLGLLPKFERFFSYMLRILEEDGVLVREGSQVILMARSEEIRDPRQIRRELATGKEDLEPLLRLLDRVERFLGPVLRGEMEALDVLYPEGSSKWVEELYQGIDRYRGDRIYIELLRRWLRRLVRKAKGTLRILEIGGGNGFLTRVLARELADGDVPTAIDYWFTDLGTSFVVRARELARKRGWGFLRSAVLDISRNPISQGFAPHSFDLILGLNVVHATPRIEETLGHLRSLLSPGGLLALIEGVKSQRWNNLIWGLTDGWWSFQDTDIRAGSPLLSAGRWRKVLARQPFEKIQICPSSSSLVEEIDHALLLAQQPVEMTPMVTSLRALAERLESKGAEVMLLETNGNESLAKTVARAEERFGPVRNVVNLFCGTSPDSPDRLTARMLAELFAHRRLDLFALCTMGWEDAGEAIGDAFPEALLGVEGSETWRERIALCWKGEPNVLVDGIERILERPGLTGFTVVAGEASWASAIRAGTAEGEKEYRRPVVGTPYVAPETPIEKKIAELWQSDLGIERVGIHDNFLELGGDSLVGLRVMSRLKALFPIDLPVRLLFDAPTVSSLALAVERALTEALEAMPDEEAERLVAALS